MHDRALWEILVFSIALGVSLTFFVRRVAVVEKLIRGARPDADFTLAPVARRAAVFIREVLLQSKVIRERPLAGVAHALVFWGFCAFALVTLNHLAEGFGLAFLSPLSPFGIAYLGLASAFAVGVSVGITVLAVRRFVAQPKWLGKVAPESGFIALLILTLMLTYLADAYFISSVAVARINWWVHTLALLVFLPLIPGTKHLHLMLSPVAVFLRRGAFSKIPPLAGDEDFGLNTGKDITQLVALQAFSCVECGRCMEHCPANATGKELNPKEIALGMRRYLREFGTASEEPLLGKHIAMDAAFQCTTCGACEYQCPVGVEHLPIIVGLRRGAVNTGAWEDDYGGKLFVALERNGNPLGLPASDRDKFIQKNQLPLFDGSQEYCLWLGCMGSYDPRGREIVLALTQVLRYLNISFGVLKKEKCSGDAARRLGNDLAFGELAQFNIDQIAAAGARKLVSICPHCVRTIGEDWKELGATIAIEHHSELLARHRNQLPRAAQGSVVFHDPCYLGRYRDVYDQPREVAALGGKLVEAEHHHGRSFCCGAGGGLVFLGEEQGERISAERTRQLAATGADCIAAACPFCNTMFRDALNAMPEPRPRLADIAEIAAAAINARP